MGFDTIEIFAPDAESVPANDLSTWLDDCQLEVFASESEVKRTFETLCLVEGYTSTRMFADRTMTGAIEEARPKLCGCGADAAIIVDGSSSTASFWAPATLNEVRGHAKLKGIRFVE